MRTSIGIVGDPTRQYPMFLRILIDLNNVRVCDDLID